MRDAAADLSFEEGARLRDELKRLRATELAVVDDPTAKHPRAGSSRTAGKGRALAPSKVHKPSLDEMGIATYHEVKPLRPDAKDAPRRSSEREAPRKPTLDEMGPGPESKPYRPGPRSTTGKPGMHRGGKP